MPLNRPVIIGHDGGLQDVLRCAERVARTSLPVLIHGESGTGKELLARYVHEHSERSSGPFVTVNSAAIATDLLEAEMFGHERGAFTGAVSAKAGLFEQAHGGTLFLDEIGDMAHEHQAKVLRATQGGEIKRVGGTSPRFVDVRLIAATHHDLEGKFRKDLLFRLAGYVLHLPALRNRGRDVLDIARAVLEYRFPGKTLSRDAEVLMLAYAWPGNIRELEFVLQAAAVDAPDGLIQDAHVRKHLRPKSYLPSRANRKDHPALEGEAGTSTEMASVVELAAAVSAATKAVEVWLRKRGMQPANRDERPALDRQEGTAERSTTVQPAAGAAANGTAVERETRSDAGPVLAAAATTVLTQGALSLCKNLALCLAKEHGRFSRRDYELEAGVLSRTAGRVLAALVKRGELVMVGQGKAVAYGLPSERK